MDRIGLRIRGHVLIRERESQKILVDKFNAIHYENMSEALAASLANRSYGVIDSMVFGNGASTISGIGAVTYFPPNITGQSAALYNQTYSQVINDANALNPDITNNYLTINHVTNNVYTDIVVTCLLDYNVPNDQDITDMTTNNTGNYVFNELGLKSYNSVPSSSRLLTHVIFHPVQKALDRQIEIIYTLRIYMD